MGKRNLSRRDFITTTPLAPLALLPLGYTPQAMGDDDKKRYGIKGRLAPPLQVDYWIDAQGRPGDFKQQQLSGKWVYLKCFQNWCPGCHEYGFPALKRVADTFAKDPRVEVLAIQTVFEGYSSNTKEDLRKLQLRYELPIMMGHDPGDPQTHTYPQTMRDYRTGGTPWVVIIDPSGKVVFNHFHIEPDEFIPQLQKILG
ncbi:MAG: TlpA disulfide reductase family protein [Candidatus Thiodiazotropha taylori]|nr:TlpA family protein disulfide reductase [Candidatus Thiodiazotropha taylori]